MVISPSHVALLEDPMFSFWIGTAGRDHIPEVVKCMGVIVDPVSDRLTCFAGAILANKSLLNLQENPAVTLVGASVLTYEGYQYKGTFINSRFCTAEDILFQENYMRIFTSNLAELGYSEDGLYKLYFSQPSVAIEFRVMEIYEQSPRKGTGEKVKG
jgi:hypothetical protein